MAQAAQPLRRTGTGTALQLLGGVCAALVALFLLFGVWALTNPQEGLGLRNWLVVLFQMNSKYRSLPVDPLRINNPIDIAILALVGLTFLGLWPAVGRAHRVWAGIAVAMPFLGIAVLLVTGQAGRSAVMGAGLVISVLLLVGRQGRLIAITGLVANLLLLVGDLTTGILPGPFIAPAIAAGYVVLIAWFAALSVGLVQSA